MKTGCFDKFYRNGSKEAKKLQKPLMTEHLLRQGYDGSSPYTTAIHGYCRFLSEYLVQSMIPSLKMRSLKMEPIPFFVHLNK